MNIVITGAGKGIGFECVKHFLEEGSNQLIALSRDVRALKKISNSNLLPLSLDLENEEVFQSLANTVEEHFEYIDILLCNAGTLVNKAFADQEPEDFDHQFNVNVKAVFLSVKALLPLMRPGTHIVTISSMAGFQGSRKFPGLSLYSASKAAVASLTECMAMEFSGSGIKVNSLALGAVQTKMLTKAFPGLKAPLNAAEMASFICDFAMTGGKYMNGQIVPVTLSNP